MANNQMPHNLEAESAILGCILIDGDIQSELLETLREDDFYQESNRLVLDAMKKVYAARKPVDIVTLTDMLEQDGTLERAGGLVRITELAEVTPSAANYKQYFEIIRRDAIRRALIRAAKGIIEVSTEGTEAREAVSYAEKQIYDISKQEDGSQLAGLADGVVIREVLGKFEEIQSDPNAFRGLETGFKHLDRITNGLQRSDLIVIAARPGMGKTSLAMNIVENICLVKKRTAAVFSLEMPRSQIVQRLLCAHANVSMEKALSGKLVQKEWKNLMIASDKLQKSKLFIDDSSRVTPAEVLSKCRRLSASAGGLDLVMIDYIQLMGSISGGGSSEMNRQQEIAGISRDLKLMAKELNVPVIALSQLRRIQTKEPQLSDLRESGAIEQDADIVMFINRPEATATAEELASGKIVKGAAELVIAKHRNGSQGRLQLRFIGEQTKFVDVDAQNRDDEPPVRAVDPADYDDAPSDGGEELPPPDESHPAALRRVSEDDMPF